MERLRCCLAARHPPTPLCLRASLCLFSSPRAAYVKGGKPRRQQRSLQTLAPPPAAMFLRLFAMIIATTSIMPNA